MNAAARFMKLRAPGVLCGAIVCAACGVPSTPDRPAAVGESAAEPAAEPAEVSAAARALEELSGAYDDLAALVDRNPGEAVQWAQGDLENLGDFEYRILEFAGLTAAELEAELNSLGDERWEVFWMEATPTGVRVYLKRSAISYLSRLPLSAIVRLFGGGGQ